jgi:hypothetical protein
MKSNIVLSLSLLAFFLGGAPSFAQANIEERVFRIKVEDRDAGQYAQKITTYSDGTTDVESKADVKVKVLTMTFQYAYRGHERWKEGQLHYLASSSNDDGKTHTLMVTLQGKQLKVKEGGKERLMNGDAWSTSYWTLPPAARRTQPLILVDADSGEEHRVQMQVVGKTTLQIGTQQVPCTHYRVTGTIKADLWFDERDRLVRRESLRKGRKAVVELQAVTVH